MMVKTFDILKLFWSNRIQNLKYQNFSGWNLQKNKDGLIIPLVSLSLRKPSKYL